MTLPIRTGPDRGGPVRIGINGLGRVGRALVRLSVERADEIEVVAVNDPAPAESLARLLAHDSLHGRFPGTVAAAEGALTIDGRRIPLTAAPAPAAVRWDRLGDEAPRIVVEATGHFRARDAAAGHLGGPVERVVISATAEGVDATFCYGINHRSFDPGRHTVVSNASCTTNCLAPVAMTLDRSFGIEGALMSTVHCYTNSQRLVDMSHPDPRRARAAGLNIIPTTSDAVEAIGEVLPRLAGKIDGLAYRVPVPDGSLIDLNVRLAGEPELETIADALRRDAEGELAGIMRVTEEELVSSDYIGDPHSAIVDLPLLQQVDHCLYRVVAWYDNEWGYANRLADLLGWIARETAR